MKEKIEPEKLITCRGCKKTFSMINAFETIIVNKNIPQIGYECPYCSKNLGSLAYRDSSLVKEILVSFVNWELQKLAQLRNTVVKEKNKWLIRNGKMVI